MLVLAANAEEEDCLGGGGYNDGEDGSELARSLIRTWMDLEKLILKLVLAI